MIGAAGAVETAAGEGEVEVAEEAVVVTGVSRPRVVDGAAELGIAGGDRASGLLRRPFRFYSAERRDFRRA